jgi:hypothetical protein
MNNNLVRFGVVLLAMVFIFGFAQKCKDERENPLFYMDDKSSAEYVLENQNFAWTGLQSITRIVLYKYDYDKRDSHVEGFASWGPFQCKFILA